MPQIKTIQFPNTAWGQKKKNETLVQYLNLGWKVVSETITPGRYKTENACCMFAMCGPCGAFMGGHTDGTINITIQHDGTPDTTKLPKSASAKKFISPTEKIKAVLALLITAFIIWVGYNGYQNYTTAPNKTSEKTAASINYPGFLGIKWGTEESIVRAKFESYGLKLASRRNVHPGYSEDYIGQVIGLPVKRFTAHFDSGGLVSVEVDLNTKTAGRLSQTFKHTLKLMTVKYGIPTDDKVNAVGQIAIWKFRNDTCLTLTNLHTKQTNTLRWVFSETSEVQRVTGKGCSLD